MRVGLWAAFAAAFLVAGCQTGGDGQRPVATAAQPSAATPGVAPQGFACPPAGTRLAFSSSNILTYTGTDPNDPTVCLATGRSGEPVRMLGNWFPLGGPDEAAQRRHFMQLWPMTPGKTFTYTAEDRNAQGTTYTLRRTWRVIGPRRIQIAGAERDVIVVEEDQEFVPSNRYLVTWTYFYDEASRSFIGGDINVVRGEDRRRNWRVQRIEAPRGT
jgi:hypothetical protein